MSAIEKLFEGEQIFREGSEKLLKTDESPESLKELYEKLLMFYPDYVIMMENIRQRIGGLEI